jgi:arachidonate 15-lipoxygenase
MAGLFENDDAVRTSAPDEEREAERAAARETYRYTWHEPDGVATAVLVPKSDGFSPGYVARYAAVVARLKARMAAMGAASHGAHVVAGAREHESPRAAADAGRAARATPDVTLRWFGDDVPAFVELRGRHPERDDLLFAWQRLGGANNMAIRAVGELPEGFALSDARFAAVILRSTNATDSLATALRERRVFLADYGAWSGARTGRIEDGPPKHLYATRAVFAQVPGAAFVPVAIQIAPGEPVQTPGDGAAWTVAKLAAQAADAQQQALVWHLGHCHFVMEAVALATMRELAARHPVRKLLTPHLQFTLAINEQVRDTLMKPGGDLEKLLAMTRGQALSTVADAVAAFDYPTSLPPANVATRGLGDPSTLSQCPLREDGLDFWGAIHAFVGAYVAIHYDAEEAVAADAELRAWTADLRSHWGGRLRTIPDVRDRAALTDLVSFVLWSAGPLHTMCNYAQNEFMSDSASMPLALFGEAPRAPVSDADLLAQYTPEDQSRAQYAFFYEQTRLDESRFGHYPRGTFDDDPRVAPLCASFVAALDAVDARIVERNATRPAAYEWLRPAHTRGSIHS